MKKIILVALFVFVNVKLLAQQNSYNGKIIYNFTSAQGDNEFHEMIFNNDESYYQLILDSISEKKKTIISLPKPEMPTYVYRNFKNKKIEFLDRVVLDFFRTEEDLKKINWIISNEEKKIGSFICTKANGVFKDVPYVAWFTMDIPITAGPWKIHGLPGLILEVQNEFGVNIKAVYVATNTSINTDIIKKNRLNNKSVTNVSYLNYCKIKQNELTALDRFYESLFPRGEYFGIESYDPVILEKFN